jgi:predicted RNA-binding Zn-ribbon protein involved in translation (DUF1610 family)
MARARTKKTTAASPRKTRRSSTAKTSPAASSGEFVCPECGRSFGRAAALGAHRRQAHGVAGKTTPASRRARRSAQRTAASRNGRRTRARRTNNSATVNRDALLKTLFPAGIPASEQVMRAVTAWLDEGERLARLR